MDEIRMYTKEELKDTIEEQKDEIVKLKNLLFEKNRTIEEQCSKIDDMKTEIDHLTEQLNSPIGYLDLDLVDKQNELERLKNLLKGKAYTIKQQLKDIDCYRKEEIRELKEKLNKDEQDTIEKQNTMGYAPMNFVLDGSNSSYSEYAIHLMRKYEALTDAGFSHDDAMCLIPMWDDADFENFKKEYLKNEL